MAEEVRGKKGFKEEYDYISEGLQLFGLTEYQARTYTALVAHGVADAETIATTSELPRTSVYKALDSLHDIGYVVVNEGRPRIYRPAEPLEVKGRLSDKLDDIFGRLNTIYEILSERGEPQVVYTINGEEKVLEKIAEMLKKTNKEVIISTPKFSTILDAMEDELASALKRDITVTVVTSYGERVLDGMDVERRDRLIATDIISDGKRALLASPGLEACGYTNNPALSRYLVNFMDILMERVE
ncbi:MAG: TrmB family transcriptional regulator [Thermoplasmatota archaeon]